eukprot:scaffold214313_cov17-Tisochrysis_lutea.AAC.1
MVGRQGVQQSWLEHVSMTTLSGLHLSVVQTCCTVHWLMKNLWVDAPLRTSGARAPAWLMCTFDESKFAQYSVKADRVTTSTISSHG